MYLYFFCWFEHSIAINVSLFQHLSCRLHFFPFKNLCRFRDEANRAMMLYCSVPGPTSHVPENLSQGPPGGWLTLHPETISSAAAVGIRQRVKADARTPRSVQFIPSTTLEAPIDVLQSKNSTLTNIRWKDLAPKGQQRCKLQPKKYVKAGDPKDVKPSYVLVTKNLTLGYTADQISTYPMLNNRPPVCVPIISLQTTSLPWFYRDRDSAGCKLWAGGGKKNLHDRLGKKKQEQIVWG